MPGNGVFNRVEAGSAHFGTASIGGTLAVGAVNAGRIQVDYIEDRHGNEVRTVDLRDGLAFLNTQVDGITTATDVATVQIEDLRARIIELEAKLQDIISNPERKYVEIDGKHLFWLLADGGQ